MSFSLFQAVYLLKVSELNFAIEFYIKRILIKKMVARDSLQILLLLLNEFKRI